MYKLLVILGLAITGAFFFIFGKSDQSYKLTEAEFIIQGTSSMHDWEMKSNKAIGNAKIKVGDNTIKEIHSLNLSISAESLKSGKKGMDKKAYNALNSSQFSRIIFELKKVTNLEGEGKNIKLNATGNLFIAGVSQMINLKVSGKLLDDKIIFEGEHPLKMTDFNIDPPKALLGTLKTGNDITLKFTSTWKTK